jgi:hypothetical protein
MKVNDHFDIAIEEYKEGRKIISSTNYLGSQKSNFNEQHPLFHDPVSLEFHEKQPNLLIALI